MLKKRISQSGFTLIELLIVVAIMGILSATFVTMGTMVRDFRVGYIHQRLYSSIELARSEAIKRSENITLCRSVSGTQCSAGSDWSDGWLVFYDQNGNRRVDSNDQLIRIYNQISSDFVVTWGGPSEGLFYNKRGQINFRANNEFTICLLDISDSPIRKITIYGSEFGGGRVKSISGRGNC